MTRISYALILSIILFVVSCAPVESEEEKVNPETIGMWTKLNQGIALPGTEDMFCFNNSGSIYAIFQDGGLFSFSLETFESQNEDKLLISEWNTGARFTAIPSGNETFIASSIDNKLYSFANKKWTEICELGFYYDSFGGYYQGLLHENKVFFVNSSFTKSYNLNTKLWDDYSMMPAYWEDENHMNHVVYGGYSLNGVSYNGKIYIIKSEGDIFEYNLVQDQWTHIAKYPGVILDKIVCIAANNKLYLGLSHIDHSPSYSEEWLENEFWSLNLSSLNWNKEENIPFELKHGEIFHVVKNNRLYIGHAPLTKYYHLYRFEF